MKSPEYIEFSMFLYWVLYTLINVIFPMYVAGNLSSKPITKKKILDTVLLHFKKNSECQDLHMAVTPWCFTFGAHDLGQWLPAFHAAQAKEAGVQHICRNWVFPRPSQQTTVTQNILVMLGTFVSLNTLASVFRGAVLLFLTPTFLMGNISALSAACFPPVFSFFS